MPLRGSGIIYSLLIFNYYLLSLNYYLKSSGWVTIRSLTIICYLLSINYSLAASSSSIILMAEVLTGVPGPKTAATPASKSIW